MMCQSVNRFCQILPGKRNRLGPWGILKLGLALNDIIRNDAAAMVSDLKRLGCQPVMLTGDAEDAGKSVFWDLHGTFSSIRSSTTLNSDSGELNSNFEVEASFIGSSSFFFEDLETS